MIALRMYAAIAIAVVVISPASADPLAEGKGRYTMTPVEGGFMRLDTESGAVAMCARKGDAWACEPVNDRTVSSDGQSKLETENRALKERIKSLEDSIAAVKPPSDGGYPVEPPGGVSKLPTEEDVDKALDYVERMFKKFRDRAKKFDEHPGATAPKHDGGSGAL